ncbi:MAG TPA: acyloxyacyl hydrolase [Edaphobacter sp.]|nr:acyloxyacyl hydrolase [Edaphobacter sp.]
MNLRCLLASLLISLPRLTQAQEPQHSFRQSFSTFAEYSNTSSRIVLGASEDRRFAALGFGYALRLLHTRHFDWYYAPEILPLVFLQDPVATESLAIAGIGSFHQSAPTVSTCKPASFTIPPEGPPALTYSRVCSTRWTYAGGISPLGQRFNFRPRRQLQPFVIGNAGFLVATRDVPVNDSSRFNFTFEFGAGLELRRSPRHSWSIEYRLHHLSNDYTGTNNPGVDNQLFRLTYSLSR